MSVLSGEIKLNLHLLLVFILIYSNSAFAQTRPRWSSDPNYNQPIGIPVPTAPAPPPEHVKSGDKYYDASLDGLDEYLQEIRENNPKVYQELRPRLEKMKSDNTTALWLIWGGCGAGLVVGLIGALQTKKETIGTTIQVERTKSDPNYALIGAGTALFATGLIWGMSISPGRKDFLNFINKHNDLNPSSSLKLQMGYNPIERDAVAALIYHF